MTGKTAKYMSWNHDRNVVESELSHPTEKNECKQSNRRFSKEIRNVRLGFCTDGFDPFHNTHARDHTI